MKHKSHRILFFCLAPILVTAALGEVEDKNDPKNITHGVEAAGDTQDPAWRASEIIGTEVKASNDDKIGDIKDLVIDFKSGEILGVVVSTGGFLGIGDSQSTIPRGHLRYDERAKGFKTSLTKEQLEKAPRHDNKTWNDDRRGVRDNLRNFGETVGAVGDSIDDTVGSNTQGRDMDNTGRNKRDRRDTKVTPENQGNSDTDLKTTQNIRSAVMDTDLSFNAKNIKIITSNSRVTLRGVVDSADEQKAIVEIARRHAGETNVKDEIEVNKD